VTENNDTSAPVTEGCIEHTSVQSSTSIEPTIQGSKDDDLDRVLQAWDERAFKLLDAMMEEDEEP
jgi:hypothetical protein